MLPLSLKLVIKRRRGYNSSVDVMKWNMETVHWLDLRTSVADHSILQPLLIAEAQSLAFPR